MLSKKCCLFPSFPFVSWSESGWWYSCDRESERFHFATVTLHENPSSSQLNANRHDDKKWLTEQDQVHACPCLSLSIASQKTQYYLQTGYGLAYAVASAEMALLWGRCLCRSILLRNVFCGSILLRRVFCGFILSRCVLCGSILLRLRLCGSIGVFADWSCRRIDLADLSSWDVSSVVWWPCGFDVFAFCLALWLDLADLSSWDLSSAVQPCGFNIIVVQLFWVASLETCPFLATIASSLCVAL
jgi:hypothetical protein